MTRGSALLALLFCFALSIVPRVATATCNEVVSAANAMSTQVKAVQSHESAGEDALAKSAWNQMNHDALQGAHAFNSCDDTSSRLSYAVSFADATAVGMHYGLISWSEGSADIGGSLQIIDALPHSPTVKQEWDLVDRLYTQACGMHGVSCAKRTY